MELKKDKTPVDTWTRVGGTGIIAGLLLLALNLDTFPAGPAYAGSIDLGPVVALWFLAVFVRLLLIKDSSH